MDTQNIKGKILIDKEDVEIEGKTYFISQIPATQAQRLFLAGFGALTNKTIGSLPPAMMEELLSFCGTYNDAGTEVQFVNLGVVDMFVKDMFVLLELEHLMVRKNFSFLFDGRGEALVAQLSTTPLDSQLKNTETSTP